MSPNDAAIQKILKGSDPAGFENRFIDNFKVKTLFAFNVAIWYYSNLVWMDKIYVFAFYCAVTFLFLH